MPQGLRCTTMPAVPGGRPGEASLADIMEKWELSEDRDESEILDLIAEHFPDEDIEDIDQAVKMTALRKQLLGPV